MSTVVLVAVLVAVWAVIITFALRWLAAAADAGEQFDQTMADHYRCPDEVEP
jgi:hypothetical protein